MDGVGCCYEGGLAQKEEALHVVPLSVINLKVGRVQSGWKETRRHLDLSSQNIREITVHC